MASLETLEGIWNKRPGGLGFTLLAEALEGAGRLDEAAQVLQEGLSRWPKSLPGRLLRGRVAHKRGDFELARSSFQSALDIDASCRSALEGLAESSAKSQYLRQAFETWSRLAALEPDHPRASAQVRALAQSLDRPAGLDPVALVHDHEDQHSREALSEGTSSLIASPAASAGLPAFHMDMGEPPSASGFTASRDLPTIPELPGFQPPSAVPNPAPSASLLGKVEESSFATLEMPSFSPARTIPPPPLELPKVAPPLAAPEPPVVPGRFPGPQDRADAEATQFLASPGGRDTHALDRVTGDDVGDRFDAVFGAPSTPMALADVPPTAVDFPVVQSSGKVTGGDVAGRLDELFGESSVPAPAPVAAQPQVQMPPPVVAPPLAAPVLPPVPPMAPEVPAPRSAPVSAGQPVVSGDDIEGRLDDLFGESVIDLTGPLSAPPTVAHGSDTSTMPREAMLAPSSFTDAGDTAAMARDTTIEAQILPKVHKPAAESTAELSALSSIDLSSLDVGARSAPDARANTRLTAEDVDSRLDELFASSEFQADPAQAVRRTGFVPRSPTASAQKDVVTGDDIEGRLDDLFGGDSDFPVGLPTVTFAEEYLRQGHRDKAASIYRQLLDKDPQNADLRRRLNEIEGRG